jgi:hypothetical protein
MKPMRLVLSFFILLVMVFAAGSAKAQCWGYSQFTPERCSSPGCMGSYTPTYCRFGCVSGTCENQGGSGQCCGHLYYTAVIYPDGQDSCHDLGCGENGQFRRVHGKTSRVDSQYSAELRQGYTPGLIMLSARLSYKPPRLVYAFSRCNHSFRLIIEDGRVSTTGGM